MFVRLCFTISLKVINLINMKILVFSGGLGNQIFGYAFCEYLRGLFPNHKFYGVYNNMKMNEHYGLEINKWFYVNLPPSKWYISLYTYFLYLLKKIFRYNAKLDLSVNVMENPHAVLFWAFHLDKRYIPSYKWINFKVNEAVLTEKNKKSLMFIRDSNSFFIHVRRNDYLSPKYKSLFEGTCDVNYYRNAIAFVIKHYPDARFFVFSDDILWAKKNLSLNDAFFIDWNVKENSPLDMFLMSNCAGGIIANSTFSYWGAMLGNKKKCVVCPSRWFSPPYDNPNLYMQNWIVL